MKRPFKVTIDVMAYSQEDAQAKVELLLQMGAFCKDFNVNNLAGSVIKSFLISKCGEIGEKIKLDLAKEKQQKTSTVAVAFHPPKSKG